MPGLGRPPTREGLRAYIPTSPSLDGCAGSVVRKISDLPKIEIDNAVSEVYHRWWAYGESFPWGGFDRIVGDSENTKKLFDQLSHLLQLMQRVTFHHVNLSIGSPVDESDYRYERVGIPPDETYIDLLPVWIAEMDAVDAAVGGSTRFIRDGYIALTLELTGVDLTGIF